LKVVHTDMSYQRLEDQGDYRQYYSAPPPPVQPQVPVPPPAQPAAAQYYQAYPSPAYAHPQQPQAPYGGYEPSAPPVAAGVPPPPSGVVYAAAAPMYAQPVFLQQAHPGVAGHVIRGIWSDGIFDCFDSGVICLLSLFLPCVRWGMTISRAKYLTLPIALLLYALPYILYQALYTYLSIAYPSTYGTDPVSNYDVTYVVVLTFMIVCHISTIVIGAYYRNKLRADYQIGGNAAEDCCWHMCCACCAIAQEARHVDRDYAIPV